MKTIIVAVLATIIALSTGCTESATQTETVPPPQTRSTEQVNFCTEIKGHLQEEEEHDSRLAENTAKMDAVATEHPELAPRIAIYKNHMAAYLEARRANEDKTRNDACYSSTLESAKSATHEDALLGQKQIHAEKAWQADYKARYLNQ